MYLEPGQRERMQVSDRAETVLRAMAERFSCRVFDGSPIAPEILREIIADGTEAPSSCNHQMWHFVIVTDRAALARACEISGGNPHFAECSALIFLCFQKGWSHNNFSVVQSVAAAAYHMSISAHLRGLHTIWNAGIGPHAPLRELMQIPPLFEIQGALAVGRATDLAPRLKAPRRPLDTILSYGTFQRPADTIYPVKPAETYPFEAIRGENNPYAVWDPAEWRWAQIADFRGFAVWAKSPIAGVYVSRRNAEAEERELDLLPPLAPGARVVEIMPWGGTSTVALARRLPEGVTLDVAELSEGNILFIRERLAAEGVDMRRVGFETMVEGRLPHADTSVDVVIFPQTLEHVPDRPAMLAEAARVLKPGGALVLSARNMVSRYGREWRRTESRGQVPNQGPFIPLPARTVRDEVRALFTIEDEVGIGEAAGHDAVVTRGWSRYGRRLYALRATPKG
ncbi:nitroreductase family protein [Acuticoccus kandeliae]|uniref:nitroreductase family protein n=1 Tax=Acuticoccus kandeliae TaxID=2073160 RepID=UPI000D3E43E3|nr:nitroreductase family protein [Acuticoccus kandeliae]